MNIFHKFTRKSLMQNRTRTVVTLVGIILSVALVTAVLEGAYSGMFFLQRTEVEQVGAFHGYYYDLTKEEALEAQEQEGVEAAASWQQVGWAEIGSANEYKPYLLIESISSNFTELVAVNLQAGRMPENEYEILLPEHLADNGNVYYHLGDTITLVVGQRMQDGYQLNEYNPFNPDVPEEISDAREKTYTVVGFYSRFDNLIEDFSCPGYTALTAGAAPGSYHVFFTLDVPSNFYSYMEMNAVSMNWREHDDLLRTSGTLQNNNLAVLLYGLAAVLLFLISFGSISLIYNAFSISVSERTRQLGILKSVGATKKQIRTSVLYESFVLLGIGIPVGLLLGCTGIGIALWWLQDAFIDLFGNGISTKISLVLSPVALLIATVISIFTTLIAAWIPAKRTIQISAIDAIRQTQDVKIKGKDIKTAKWTRKLFGFEGMMALKNFKRNRKRYRSTIFSLFLSVTLFVSASSFSAYLKDTVNGIANDTGIDITYYTAGVDRPYPEETLSLLSSADDVLMGVFTEELSANGIIFNKEDLSESYTELPFIAIDDKASETSVNATVVFVDDATFKALLRENNLNIEDYFVSDTPKALIYNQGSTGYSVDNEPTKWYAYQLLNEQSLPSTGYLRIIREFDGYYYMGEEAAPDGTTLYLYYPMEYMESFWSTGEESGEVLNPDMALRLSKEEAIIQTELVVDAIIPETAFSLSNNNIDVIYPYSMKEAVMGLNAEKVDTQRTDFAFVSENHAQTFDSMKEILIENQMTDSSLYDWTEETRMIRLLLSVVNFFAYGFIILISLIAIANVFNTLSTNIALRRREFAMLKSTGMSDKGFRKMMVYECIIYGAKGLLWGLPASILMTFIIYRITGVARSIAFYIPWYSIVIAITSVFVVVFATMLYATGKIKRDNLIDDLRTETL